MVTIPELTQEALDQMRENVLWKPKIFDTVSDTMDDNRAGILDSDQNEVTNNSTERTNRMHLRSDNKDQQLLQINAHEIFEYKECDDISSSSNSPGRSVTTIRAINTR